MQTSDIAQILATEIVEQLPGTTLRIECLRGDAEHHINEIFRKIAKDVVEEIPGTIRHINCAAPEAESIFANALETVLGRLSARQD